MPRYAPAREDGLQPYVVEISDWGHRSESLVYARNAPGARWEAMGRKTVGRYVTKTRRATTDDVAKHEEATA